MKLLFKISFVTIFVISIFCFGSVQIFSEDKSSAPKAAQKEDRKNSQKIIYGKVYVDDKGDVSILENWQSRSRVSYFIEGPLAKDISLHKGKYARISGTIIKENSPWNKRFEAKQILEVTDKPVKQKQLKINNEPLKK